MNFASLEWALLGLAILGSVTLVSCLVAFVIREVSGSPKDGSILLLAAFFAAISCIVLYPATIQSASSRNDTLSARHDLQAAGITVNMLSVSRHAVEVEAGECQFDLTLEKRNGHFRVFLQMINGSQIVATPEKLKAMCRASQ